MWCWLFLGYDSTNILHRLLSFLLFIIPTYFLRLINTMIHLFYNRKRKHVLVNFPSRTFGLYFYKIIIIYSSRVFHISFSWWFFTGVWVTVSLLKSPGLFPVFWPFSIMLKFGWSPLVFQFPCLLTVPKAPITIDIIVTFMFHSFSMP